MENVPPQNNYPASTIPSSQLPPGYATPMQNQIGPPGAQSAAQGPYGIKPDFNSNSPQHGTLHYTSGPQMGPAYTNNLGTHSSNNSPAFNKPGAPPTSMPTMNSQASPHRPPLQQSSPRLPPNMAPPTQYAPPVSAPSIRPPVSYPGAIPNSSSSFNQYPSSSGIVNPTSRPPQNQMQPAVGLPQQPWPSQPSGNPNVPSSQPPQTYTSAQQPTVNGPSRPTNTMPMGSSGLMATGIRPSLPPPTSQYGPPSTSAAGMRPTVNPVHSVPMSGPLGSSFVNPSTSRPQMGPPLGQMGAPSSGPPLTSQPTSKFSPGLQSGPPLGPPNGPPIGPPLGPPSGPPIGPPSGPPLGPPSRPQLGPPSGPPLGPQSGPPLGPPIGLQSPGLQPGPPSGPPLGPPSGPANAMYAPGSNQSSMNNRYPQNVPAQAAYNQQTQPVQQQSYQQYNAQGPQGLTNQMSQMNITQSGFNQMWGQQMFDLLQTRHILPEYPEDPPEIRLGQQFAGSINCSPEIFRCTINRIPETNALLQKSRLPLGILIHPFKDLNHLPVIQCTSIVRCRACRTYINPFVYFVDSKRWKCNLCYRVNDLPEEFQYDPVSKSYGDPTRRPEIKSATIEFIAPGEYMLRPPQPAIYLFLLDVSHIGRESQYLQVFCETLKTCLDQLPGDGRTQVGFICYDANVHFYLMGEGLTRPREMTVIDIDDVFLPSPESLLVNLGERREMIQDLLDVLPRRHSTPGVPTSALGAALQAAFKLMAATGGRVTVLQTCLPNVGPGSLASREDPNARSSKDVAHLNPATDFYKRLALECSGAQIAVDLFLISSQYSDLATLSGISKFSGGSVYHMPLFSAKRSWQADQLRRMLTRYLTRKIGFEAVMRIRCTRGIGIHTFHGNFFVRSTDLLSLPNVSPDSGFGMQLTIEESLSDLQQVCFQAALLYTSSKGERRIRVHTLCLPVANNLTDVLHSADQQCIVGLLTKMAVDRAQQSSLSDAREALSNVAVDTLSAHRLAQNLPSGSAAGSLHAPACLRLLPLYLSALLKHVALRVGVSTRLDDRFAAMCNMKSLPLSQLLRSVYPDLYPIHQLQQYLPQPQPQQDDEEAYPDPPRLHLTAERINSNGAYLLDDGELMILYIGSAVSPAFLSDTFGVPSYMEVVDEARELPHLDTAGNALLLSFVEKLNEERPYAANVLVLRDNSPSRKLFTERLVDDRLESTFSYYEFLQHVKSLMK